MPAKTVLFTRDYRFFSGGHLKHSDYFKHVQAADWLDPVLHVTAGSEAGATAASLPQNARLVDLPYRADFIFAAGLDWDLLDAAGQDTSATPVVNLIQHVRHADPQQRLYKFLTRPAIRICVSAEVAFALERTQIVNGPIIAIENAIDVAGVSRIGQPGKKHKSVLISGLKDPGMARSVSEILAAHSVPHKNLSHQIPRTEYLELVSHHVVNICLPNPTEGFYLPALEAMALGVAVVVPDCIGARSFCIADETCLMPGRTASDLARNAIHLLNDDQRREGICARARAITQRHDLPRERAEFHAALAQNLR